MHTHAAKTVSTIALAVALGAGVACETPPTSSEENFGNAQRTNIELMVSSNHLPDGTPREPTAMDGPTANGVIENYRTNEDATTQRARQDESGLIQIDSQQ